MADTQVSPSTSQALPRLVYFGESKENGLRLETYNLALDLCSDMNCIRIECLPGSQIQRIRPATTCLTDRCR